MPQWAFRSEFVEQGLCPFKSVLAYFIALEQFLPASRNFLFGEQSKTLSSRRYEDGTATNQRLTRAVVSSLFYNCRPVSQEPFFQQMA